MSSASQPDLRILGHLCLRLLLFAGVGLAFGCEPWRHVSECGRVTALSNSTVSHIQELIDGSPTPTADVYEKIAAHYETLHMDLKQAKFHSRVMKRPLKRQLSLLERLARDARQYGEHLRALQAARDDGPPEAITREEQALQRLTQRTKKTSADYQAWASELEQTCSPQR